MITLDISSFSKESEIEKRSITTRDIDETVWPEIPGTIDLQFEINKVGQEFFVKTGLRTDARLVCDRCLEPFELGIDDYITIILTPNAELYAETEDDVYEITESNNEIDVTGSIKEALQIALPFKKVCKQDCKGLCSNCGNNLNTEPCNCSTEKTDPRWDALKNIKFNS